MCISVRRSIYTWDASIYRVSAPPNIDVLNILMVEVQLFGPSKIVYVPKETI